MGFEIQVEGREFHSTVEPLIKDTRNKGHNRNTLQIIYYVYELVHSHHNPSPHNGLAPTSIIRRFYLCGYGS